MALGDGSICSNKYGHWKRLNDVEFFNAEALTRDLHEQGDRAQGTDLGTVKSLDDDGGR